MVACGPTGGLGGRERLPLVPAWSPRATAAFLWAVEGCIGVSGLHGAGLAQGLLFDQEEREKQARLDAVGDRFEERLGATARRRGSSPPK